MAGTRVDGFTAGLPPRSRGCDDCADVRVRAPARHGGPLETVRTIRRVPGGAAARQSRHLRRVPLGQASGRVCVRVDERRVAVYESRISLPVERTHERRACHRLVAVRDSPGGHVNATVGSCWWNSRIGRDPDKAQPGASGSSGSDFRADVFDGWISSAAEERCVVFRRGHSGLCRRGSTEFDAVRFSSRVCSYFWPNLSRYSRWLIETETPLVLLAPVAVLFFHGSERWLSWLFVAFSAALYACYAFYLPFDSWTYLRFLLPAIALILMLSAAGILHLSSRLSSPFAKAIVAAFFVLFLAWRWETTGLKPPPANERRYAVIGEYVRDQLPPNAILLSIIHSGSVRYYSGRSTLRWDWLPAEWLEPSLVFMRSNGYRPLLLIEDWERPQYMERFSTQSKLGNLDWPPIASYHGNVRADIFDPADRDRFLAGERIATQIIGTAPTAARANAR
jgi:hypothetical protein